ncbi:MAG: hypothetical protein GY760_26975, partial [Deltaproteobacteria bacterium]|nr:hypothetical protein [Deltaproteobacteria bacterium]
MTASEKATLNFYEWEYLRRGYYLFDTPIDIEPPYKPFKHISLNAIERIDDGKVPSLLERMGSLFLQKKEPEQQEDAHEVNPKHLSANNVPSLVGFKITFPKNEDISPLRNIEFLNMLSFTNYPVSFEILGEFEKTTIQIVCSEEDKIRVETQLKAYFPNVILKPIKPLELYFDSNRDIAIADFGVSDEFVRPIHIAQSFAIDPLTSIIASLEGLRKHDKVLLQIIFKGISSPLARDIPKAVSDGRGGSFFIDAPEMLPCSKSKIETPLFSVVMRIASQGVTDRDSQYLSQEIARSITS